MSKIQYINLFTEITIFDMNVDLKSLFLVMKYHKISDFRRYIQRFPLFLHLHLME